MERDEASKDGRATHFCEIKKSSDGVLVISKPELVCVDACVHGVVPGYSNSPVFTSSAKKDVSSRLWPVWVSSPKTRAHLYCGDDMEAKTVKIVYEVSGQDIDRKVLPLDRALVQKPTVHHPRSLHHVLHCTTCGSRFSRFKPL